MKTPPPCLSPHRHRAFTLIEMLVGMAILCLMVTLMAGMIGNVSRAWHVSRDKMDSASKGRALMNTLQREIRNAVIREDLANFPNGEFSFYTTTRSHATVDDYARSLTFVTYQQKDAANQRPALYRQDKPFSYLVGGAADSPEWKAADVAATMPAAPGTLVRQLCDGVYGFRYAFIQSDGTIGTTFVSQRTAARNAAANTTPASPTVAVQVSIAVLGEQGEEILERVGLKNDLVSALDGIGTPAGAGWSAKSLWDAKILDGNSFSSFPSQVVSAIRTYERVIPLQGSIAGL